MVRTVASLSNHAYEMDTLELRRTSIISAASAQTTDRSMFPKDLRKSCETAAGPTEPDQPASWIISAD